ncbi:hypothetical protein GTY75_08625 [Streptomyces sp. SID8381]|uniref:hypothetical protein n=1 Tax=unclassified Streptomyces TaxID=2593676 RepID=UPI00036D2402|nr:MULTISPECIES: hypothetical protein [unclassified Streptomyces]MYX26732.1 hypothetical protein [Streptomyces sp. SID8381]
MTGAASLQELEELAPELEILPGRMPHVQFTQVPNWVFLSGVKPQAQALYVHLVMHLNRSRGDKAVWPTQKALAARLGLNRVQSLTPYVEQLEELGAIDVKKQRYQGKMRQRCVYTVHLVPPEGYDGPLDQGQWYDIFDAASGEQKTAQPEPEPTTPVTEDTAPSAETTPTPDTPSPAAAPKARKRGKTEKTEEEQALEEKATRGAEWWWGERKTKQNPAPKPGRLAELVAAKKIAPYVGNKSSAYHATRTLIFNALKAGYDANTIAKALEEGGRAFPSRQQFEDACATAAGVSVNRPRPGGAGRAPAYNDDATWGAARKQQKTGQTRQAKPADEDEFGLRDLADSA